ncbi:MAG: tetratricopeptide repeat protein, partial [Methylocystaceae bacterium]|nr:tetratricopeptide repeat protein [Methylocystaceae bacterium]
FLSTKKQDYDKADKMYQRAIEADPDNANTLWRYAVFLSEQKQDYDEADKMYQRAIEADPDNALLLAYYATFLSDQKQEYHEANKMHKRAIEADPDNANNLGNYAKFLFLIEQNANAISILERAESLAHTEADDLSTELAFYRYAHCPPHALRPLKRLLLKDIRSLDWYLQNNVSVAQRNGHPAPDMLPVLANVIAGNSEISELNKFNEWKECDA